MHFSTAVANGLRLSSFFIKEIVHKFDIILNLAKVAKTNPINQKIHQREIYDF